MSGVTNMSNTAFTDISSKTTERLIHNHPMSSNPGKTVSSILRLMIHTDKTRENQFFIFEKCRMKPE